jgi:hypothetical protein
VLAPKNLGACKMLKDGYTLMVIVMIGGIIFLFGVAFKEAEKMHSKILSMEARQNQMMLMLSEIYPKPEIQAYLDKAQKPKKNKIK